MPPFPANDLDDHRLVLPPNSCCRRCGRRGAPPRAEHPRAASL